MKRSDKDAFALGAPPELPDDPELVLAALSPCLTNERLERIRAVVAARSRHLIPVLEEIHDPHNASALLRSADAFGLQEVWMIRADGEFLAARRVAKGSHRWLDIRTFTTVPSCVAALRERGYRIVVATMEGEFGPADLPNAPTAVVFGNEHSGVSDELRDLADGGYAIPMVGFAESLNVSVAAAVTFFAGTRDQKGQLPVDEQRALTARFLMNSVRDPHRIIEEYRRKHA